MLSVGFCARPRSKRVGANIGQRGKEKMTSATTVPVTVEKEKDETPVCSEVSCDELARLLTEPQPDKLLIDCRSFLEYNTCHLLHSVNVCFSKLIKRRLQSEKVSVRDLLAQTCRLDLEVDWDVIVYDQCSETFDQLAPDSFQAVLINKLAQAFKSVQLLKGGFLAFQASHPTLCESKAEDYKTCPRLAVSQPCLPVSNIGPTRILPHMYLGSQEDALSADTCKQFGITYVLNVSLTCSRPSHIKETHFLRIPVNDNYSEKMTPYFYQAFQFLEKVRRANECALVHCMAGISRSPTLAISYLMKCYTMTSDAAYRYVQEKRPTISPNFNFLGQLLEFERQLKEDLQNRPVTPLSGTPTPTPRSLEWSPAPADSPQPAVIKRQLSVDISAKGVAARAKLPKLSFAPPTTSAVTISPTTALAQLSFSSAEHSPAVTPQDELPSAASKPPPPLGSLGSALGPAAASLKVRRSCSARLWSYQELSPRVETEQPAAVSPEREEVQRLLHGPTSLPHHGSGRPRRAPSAASALSLRAPCIPQTPAVGALTQPPIFPPTAVPICALRGSPSTLASDTQAIPPPTPTSELPPPFPGVLLPAASKSSSPPSPPCSSSSLPLAIPSSPSSSSASRPRAKTASSALFVPHLHSGKSSTSSFGDSGIGGMEYSPTYTEDQQHASTTTSTSNPSSFTTQVTITLSEPTSETSVSPSAVTTATGTVVGASSAKLTSLLSAAPQHLLSQRQSAPADSLLRSKPGRRSIPRPSSISLLSALTGSTEVFGAVPRKTHVMEVKPTVATAGGARVCETPTPKASETMRREDFQTPPASTSTMTTASSVRSSSTSSSDSTEESNGQGNRSRLGPTSYRDVRAQSECLQDSEMIAVGAAAADKDASDSSSAENPFQCRSSSVRYKHQSSSADTTLLSALESPRKSKSMDDILTGQTGLPHTTSATELARSPRKLFALPHLPALGGWFKKRFQTQHQQAQQHLSSSSLSSAASTSSHSHHSSVEMIEVS